MDITLILETVIQLIFVVLAAVLIPAFKKLGKNDDVTTMLKISDEIIRIATMVVNAANELDITGELIEKGKTKAEYALEQAKKELASKGISFDEDLLIAYIKAAVTKLRVEISNTTAEKGIEQG